MKTHARWVWLTVLVLGWLLDFLFWKQAPGVNFAIYAGLCLVAGFILLRLDGGTIAPRSTLLVLLGLVCATLSSVRAEPLSSALSVILTLWLMALLAITFLGGRWLEYGVADHVQGLWKLFWSIITRPLGFRSESTSKRSAGSPAWPILRGVLLALPVVFVFAVLLGSADLVFGRELHDLIQLLSMERLPEYIFRLTYIVLAALSLLGVYLHAATSSRDEKLLGLDRPLGSRFLGFVEASIVLGAVVALFAAFVVVQFRYFFGGAANISVEGYTYSEYARRGYGELMGVAILSVLLLLGLGAITRRDSVRRERTFSGLCVLVVALVGVMLVSAYIRLALYENAYGFTRLRTYVHASLIWLGVLLAVVAVLEILRRERLIAAAALLGALGFTITLNVLNVDAFIVRQNVARALRGQDLDVPYLASLSTDSVPMLAEWLDSPGTPPEINESIGAVLACRRKDPGNRMPSDWRSYSFSRGLAEQALRKVDSRLSDYELVHEDWYARIITPRGISHDCSVQWD